MPLIFSSIFGFLGTCVGGLFGFKGEQARTVQSAFDVVKSLGDTDSAVLTAQANALSVILSQGSWLERNWRPFLMILLITIVACWFFGYTPPHFNDAISPMMDRVLTMLTIGVSGYIPCRTIEKIVTQMNLSKVLLELIKKKVL